LSDGSNPVTGAVGQGAISSAPTVQRMFDRIVPRYDLMNRLMTGGRDRAWRTMAVKAALESNPIRVADIATGTGDLALALANAQVPKVIALDFSAGMVHAAQAKVTSHPTISLIRGNGMTLPLDDDSIDSLTIGFGLRNMPDYAAAVKEFARVVRPGGRIVILEMTPLKPSLFAGAFNWYFRKIVPVVGGWLSGDRAAYDYLPTSVAAFPDRERLRSLLIDAGCSTVTIKPLGFGTVALHVGTVGS
jgi:demethylmenaquinone methyltransferase/2-methoxy-6-polyprenyl-1,4-benzoquinol methylase